MSLLDRLRWIPILAFVLPALLLVISLGWWAWQRRRARHDAPRALRWAPLLVLVAAQVAGTAFHLSTDRPVDTGRSKFIR